MHSVNAAASAAEMRPLHEHYRTSRSVVTVDLPGFGFSDRSDRDYSPRLMSDALHSAVAWTQGLSGHAPHDAIGLSLGCEFLARAAAEAPASFRCLAFVSPTGFNGVRDRCGPDGSTLAKPWLHALLRGPGWGRALFDLLTRPNVVRHFLRRTFARRPSGLRSYGRTRCSRRAKPALNMRHRSFLAGKLFSADIHRVYTRLSLPVSVSHGARGDFTDFHMLNLVSDKANRHCSVYPTGAMCYFELPDRFFADSPLAANAGRGRERWRSSRGKYTMHPHDALPA